MARKKPAVAELQLSEAEWKVMRCLWRRHPASARDVLEELRPATRWAYTTVKTVLARLEAKGAVAMTMRANTSLYAPLVLESQARTRALRSLVDRAFDGAFGSLVHFLIDEEHLSKKDKAELERILAAAEKEKRR